MVHFCPLSTCPLGFAFIVFRLELFFTPKKTVMDQKRFDFVVQFRWPLALRKQTELYGTSGVESQKPSLISCKQNYL